MANPFSDQFAQLGVGKFALTDSSGTEYNAGNPFPTTATITGDVNVDINSSGGGYLVGKPSAGDFSTAYLAGTTITIGSLPTYHATLIDEDISAVMQIATDGTVTNTYTRDDAGMAVAAGVLTVTGATFAATDSFVIYTNVHRDNDVEHDAADAGYPAKIGGRARTSQIAAVANNDRSDIITNEYGEQVLASYDWSAEALRESEINPVSDHHVEETLIDETNITTNTTTYAYFDMDGYKYFSLQGETSGTAPTDVLTVTIEASNQDDGTAPATCTYQDITNALFGVASWVDTDFFAIADTPQSFKYVRVKYVTSNGAGNDADLTVYAKKMF